MAEFISASEKYYKYIFVLYYIWLWSGDFFKLLIFCIKYSLIFIYHEDAQACCNGRWETWFIVNNLYSLLDIARPPTFHCLYTPVVHTHRRPARTPVAFSPHYKTFISSRDIKNYSLISDIMTSSNFPSFE